MLYLISTPIGNLSDITYRAVDTLRQCDYLLCEDTRRSLILLDHYQIKKPLKSYHQFNEQARQDAIIEDLKNGIQIGLLSDGGTPVFCDPGCLLVKRCIQEQVPFTCLPGACAAIQALVMSGLPTHPFQFLGFLPRKENEILAWLPFILSYPGTSVFYESPQRLLHTLTMIERVAPSLRVAVARELTKAFEETIRKEMKDMISYFTEHPPRGEIVVLVEGSSDDFSANTPEELVSILQKTYKMTLADAIKTAAHLLKIPKQSIYKLYHTESREQI